MADLVGGSSGKQSILVIHFLNLNMDKGTLLQKAVDAQRESKYVDFKDSCDTESNAEWCELIKDIAAMANSGGGAIVFGIDNSGQPSNFDGTALLGYDSAKVTDKIAKYSGRQFAEFEFTPVQRGKKSFAALIILEAEMPIIFTKAGTYRTEAGKEKTAFQQGALYFRHGAKSEPGDSEDLQAVIERQVERLRRTWLSGIKKVTQAPPGSVIQVSSSLAVPSAPPIITGGRIVSDPSAPGVRPQEADSLWPHRGKKLLEIINKHLAGKTKLNTYDLQCLRRVYGFEKNHPEFCYRPFALSSPQYSDKCAKWIISEYEKDNQFFVHVREKAKQMG